MAKPYKCVLVCDLPIDATMGPIARAKAPNDR